MQRGTAAMAENKRPHSPPGAGALVKRQRTEEGSLVKGSITKEVRLSKQASLLPLRALLCWAAHSIEQQFVCVHSFSQLPCGTPLTLVSDGWGQALTALSAAAAAAASQ